MQEIEMPIFRKYRVELARHLFDWQREGTVGAEAKRTLFLETFAPYWIQRASENRGYNHFRPLYRVQVPDSIADLYSHMKYIPLNVQLNADLSRILMALENGVSMDSILLELKHRSTGKISEADPIQFNGGKTYAILKSILV